MRRTVPWRVGVPMYRCASVPSGRRRWKLKRPADGAMLLLAS